MNIQILMYYFRRDGKETFIYNHDYGKVTFAYLEEVAKNVILCLKEDGISISVEVATTLPKMRFIHECEWNS